MYLFNIPIYYYLIKQHLKLTLRHNLVKFMFSMRQNRKKFKFAEKGFFILGLEHTRNKGKCKKIDYSENGKIYQV